MRDNKGLLDYPANAGKSIVIAPNALSITSPISLAAYPAPLGSPVGSATLLQASTDDERSEVLSLTLDNPNPFDAPTATLFGQSIIARPSALIEWGVGGVQAKAEVDFDHGLSLTVPGSYLRVTGQNDRIPARTNDVGGGGVVTFARNIRLGAFCGYGSVAGTKNLSAKRTIYIDDVGIPAPIKIPAYATNFLVERIGTGNPMFLFVTDEAGNSMMEVTYPAGSGFEGPVELSGDAAFLLMLAVPAATDAIRIIFGLSF